MEYCALQRIGPRSEYSHGSPTKFVICQLLFRPGLPDIAPGLPDVATGVLNDGAESGVSNDGTKSRVSDDARRHAKPTFLTSPDPRLALSALLGTRSSIG
jgi:hypothetical protein